MRSLKMWVVPTAVAVGVGLVVPTVSIAQDQLSEIISNSADAADPANNPTVQGAPVRTERISIDGLPEGVSVDRLEWINDRRVAVYINSAAMPGEPIQVQLLLARDWYSNPTAKFPTIWALDGLRAQDDESGWTINTNIEQMYADKNVTVVLPVGGESSFYSDWMEPDNGVHYMWETFLTKELMPVLANGFRDSGDRAIVGLSMGGTAAVTIAERNPAEFKFVGSFSGYLDTTSPGMPAAIRAAQLDAGGFNTDKMWGPEGSPAWFEHDPKLNIEALRDMTVYVAAGSGRDDYGEPNSVATGQANYAGVGLEVISRRTSQTFVDRAAELGVDVITQFRESGVHSWPYWQFELNNANGYIKAALGVSDADWGSHCAVGAEIAEAAQQANLGNCVTDEYDVAGGKAADFANGRAYDSDRTEPVGLYGKIGAKYSGMGGPESWLGFPVHGEVKLDTGEGTFARFENGNIYWTPSTGAVAVPNDILARWGQDGYETGAFNYPQSEAVAYGEGLIQEFNNAYIVRTADGQNVAVQGEIAKKYGELGAATSALGLPVAEERTLDGGAFQQFENGRIYWSPVTGAHTIYSGAIIDEWGKTNWENGVFGFPTEDQITLPEGGQVVNFQGGQIQELAGQVTATER